MKQCRGTRVDGKGWVYGWYTEAYTASSGYETIGPYIERTGEGCRENNEVIPESVGQSTGLKDKAGVEIWKDDLIKAVDEILRVAWHFNRWVMMDDKGRIKEFRQIDQGFYEVIGNATDDPKLLESDHEG